jgi:hypothetical protein
MRGLPASDPPGYSDLRLRQQIFTSPIPSPAPGCPLFGLTKTAEDRSSGEVVFMRSPFVNTHGTSPFRFHWYEHETADSYRRHVRPRN